MVKGELLQLSKNKNIKGSIIILFDGVGYQVFCLEQKIKIIGRKIFCFGNGYIKINFWKFCDATIYISNSNNSLEIT